MNNIQIMHKSKDYIEKLKPLWQMENEYNELKRECKHEVVLVTHTDRFSERIDSQCIFCGKSFWKKKQLNEAASKGSNIVDISSTKIGDSDQMIREAQVIAEASWVLNNEVTAQQIAKDITDIFEYKYLTRK